MPNPGDTIFESSAWMDQSNDIIYVKVRRYINNQDGHLIKQGVIFKCTEEWFIEIDEGMEYPHRVPSEEGTERFTQVVDEIDE